ncbi:MAG: acyl-ACP--UDP-N-acetylglucosamine O-acyltransferase, partial [Bacteriovoracaceae bacterium]
MSVEIHSSAIIEEGAEFGENVKIGPYCIIGPNVKINDGTVLKSHVVMEGHTTVGKNNEIHQFCSIGVPPQDKSYKNEPTETIIGNDNLFREGVTIHRATTKQNHKTVVGNNAYLMASVHLAHDCVIGDHVTLANATLLAGHVHVGDYVTMGGACGATPFVSVGRGAFIGAASAIDRDIPHFCAALGNRIRLKGVNIIGMKRRGYSKDEISEVVEFYRIMEASAFSPKAFVERPENIMEY